MSDAVDRRRIEALEREVARLRLQASRQPVRQSPGGGRGGSFWIVGANVAALGSPETVPQKGWTTTTPAGVEWTWNGTDWLPVSHVGPKVTP